MIKGEVNSLRRIINLLRLVIKKYDKDILYGSWAGAFGNFQFMPRTIRITARL